MQVFVQFRPRRREALAVDLPDGATVAQLYDAVDHPIDGTVAIKNSKPISESEVLLDGDEVTLLSSFSGG